MKCKHCKKEIVIGRIYCSYKCKAKMPRKMRGEYVLRLLTKGNKTGEAYGITIPAKLVKAHKLIGKKFKVNVNKIGKFILYTEIGGEK